MLVQRFAIFAQPVLDLPLVRRTRRNHGLEHATIHILSQRISNLRMAGRSSDSGFVLLGDAPTSEIEAAAHEALRRMRAGEHNLAVHPNCGTNLLTTSVMATGATLIGLTGASRRDIWNRLPTVLVLVMIALIVGQPIGMSLQRYITTDGDPADLEILRITRSEVHTPLSSTPLTVHRVVTHSS